ncbi:MAG: hypothetical protein Q7V88_15430 [Actinomycetota bacterium]|nr:hypothetical protein [Actinomycetota bacterium]
MIATAEQVEPQQMHPALAAALPLLHPGAQRWLPRLLHPMLATSWPSVAWRWSRLTPTWFPVELSVAAGSATSRYACEVGPPEMPASHRLAHTMRLLHDWGRIGDDAPAPLAAAAWRRRRSVHDSPMQWGAWIGGRHDDSGDRFKVYVEVPPGERCEVVAEVGAWLADRAGQGLPGTPTMMGIDLSGGRCEWYLEPGRIDRDDVRRFAGPATLALLDELAGRAWYPTDTAFSLAGRRGEQPVATVIVGANRLLGDDSKVAERLRLVADRHGLHWGAYDALRVASAGRRAHCLLAVSAQPEPAMCIGLCPA